MARIELEAEVLFELEVPEGKRPYSRKQSNKWQQWQKEQQTENSYLQI